MTFLFDDADLQYICSAIPLDRAKGYFTKNSKEFSKLQKGFRAKSINEAQKERILFNGAKINNGFICDFINKIVSGWLEQIAEHIEHESERIGDRKQAILNTLVDSFFVNNVALYFRLAGLNEFKDEIEELQEKILSQKQAQIEAVETERIFAEKDAEIEKLKKQFSDIGDEKSLIAGKNIVLYKELTEEKSKLKVALLEIAKLEKSLADLDSSLNKRIEVLSSTIKDYEAERQRFLNDIESLQAEVNEKNTEIKKLETVLEEAVSIVKVSAVAGDTISVTPMVPKDIGEFKEYLGYNLDAFGVKNGKNLLVSHLSNILFAGQPIAVESRLVHNFANCISNVLANGSEVKTLAYFADINVETISAFLSCDSRVVVLDNFIGNMNETLLLPLFDKHKNKIIMLGIAYEKTLRYVADEFWMYAKHLNLLYTGGFVNFPQNMEDSSEFEEQVNNVAAMISDVRAAKILTEVADELGLPKRYIFNRNREVGNEEALLGVLCFELLPFVLYALEKNPLASERLQKHIKISKSAHIDLIKEWYGV